MFLSRNVYEDDGVDLMVLTPSYKPNKDVAAKVLRLKSLAKALLADCAANNIPLSARVAFRMVKYGFSKADHVRNLMRDATEFAGLDNPSADCAFYAWVDAQD